MSDLTQEKIVEIMRSERFVMLTSVSKNDGRLHSHPMTPQKVTDDAEAWFFIGLQGELAEDLMETSEVNLAFAEVGSWLSVSGHVEFENANREKIDELWNDGVAAWFEGGKDDPNLGLMRFVGESAQFWGQPGGKVASLAQIVKSKFTGDRPSGSSDTADL